jgi:SAM-dependent methyltransferase
MNEAEDYREESRRRWETAASGWAARAEMQRRHSQPVAVWLVEHVEPQPGYRILELAAGVGDTGLLAAELVQPGGSVLITDAAEAMVEAARRRGEDLGLKNVEYRLPAASVDAVLCRWGFMLMADPGAALRETRRVLRPGGRVALAAWTDYDRNAWFSVVGRALGEDPPVPGRPGPFGFSDPGHVEGLLEEAGFDEIHVEALDFPMAFAGRDEYFEHQSAMSTRLREALKAMTPAEHAKARDAIDAGLEPYVRAGGSVELPARTWVATALA